ncbi:hypothetical protein L211DRAFT_849421 [Terfezia boudieri ATCC MYA-4762]|uniref:Uncharacterized protein n=1 Tax=Terfezia boudieri ATCC MYA-4762 TaxID=1051890 RepID=A0A3N4LT41_9PEZI|nr:hypothetical protein L211DRAFT_849421 [Terfezia boudieri ATCC MYA-4762]
MPPTKLMLTGVNENNQFQLSRPSVPTFPRPLRWLTAPRAWPQPVIATSAGPAAGGYLLAHPSTLAVTRRDTDNTVQEEPTWSNSPTRGFPTSAITGLYSPRGREDRDLVVYEARTESQISPEGEVDNFTGAISPRKGHTRGNQPRTRSSALGDGDSKANGKNGA